MIKYLQLLLVISVMYYNYICNENISTLRVYSEINDKVFNLL